MIEMKIEDLSKKINILEKSEVRLDVNKARSSMISPLHPVINASDTSIPVFSRLALCTDKQLMQT